MADVGHYGNADRRSGSQERKQQGEHNEEGESATQVEQQHSAREQRQHQAPFILIQPRRDKRPRLVQQVRHGHEHSGKEGEFERHQERRCHFCGNHAALIR